MTNGGSDYKKIIMHIDMIGRGLNEGVEVVAGVSNDIGRLGLIKGNKGDAFR